MDTIAKIRAAHQNPAATADELTAAAGGARALAATADQDVAALDARRQGLLLTATDKEIARNDEAVATGRRTVEVAHALAEACDVRAAELRKIVAEQLRQQRYDAAAALLAALPAAVEPDYRELVRIGRSIVERFARASTAARAVNADLPEGRTALADAEDFRRVPGQPRKVVWARRVKLYVESNTQVIEDQSRVKPRWSVDAEGRPQRDKSVPQAYPADLGFAGEYKRDAYGEVPRSNKEEVHVRRLDFVEFESVAGVAGSGVPSFAYGLKIPALFALQMPAWNVDDRTSMEQVLQELERSPGAISPPKAPPPVFNRSPLDRFEKEWGELSKLGIAVEDGTADAVRRQSDNRHDGYKQVARTWTTNGLVDPSGPQASWLS